jgi:hypothetical protein
MIEEAKETYRRFNLYGGTNPVATTLLATVTEWSPKGTIAYARPNGVIVELTRLQLKSMAFQDEEVARCFGLELARLVLNASYRDFAIARYESEKKYIREGRGHRSWLLGRQ